MDKAYNHSFVLIYRNCDGRTRVEDMRTGRTIRQCLFVSVTQKKHLHCSKGPFTPGVSINAPTTLMILVILFSLKTMESIQYWVTAHLQVTPLFSMKKESLASSQCDSDAWFKRTLKPFCETTRSNDSVSKNFGREVKEDITTKWSQFYFVKFLAMMIQCSPDFVSWARN